MMNLIHFVKIFLLVKVVWCQSAGCPIDFVKHDDSCYLIFATPVLKWWEAMITFDHVIPDTDKQVPPYSHCNVLVAYETFFDLRRFDRAMAFCAVYGNGKGTLATIESESEQLFLEGQLTAKFPPPVGKDFWLGANDIVTEGTWVWVNRNSYVQDYTRWGPGEPSGSASEDCLALYDGLQYQWNDAPCDSPQGFICEVPYMGQPDVVIG